MKFPTVNKIGDGAMPGLSADLEKERENFNRALGQLVYENVTLKSRIRALYAGYVLVAIVGIVVEVLQ